MGQFVFNGFTYIDKLSESVINRYPDSLNLSMRPTYESILFKLLLGQVFVNHDNSDVSYVQKVNYSRLLEDFDEVDDEDPISAWIGDDFGMTDLHRYFMINRMNENMYKELLVEFTWFF